MPGGRGCGIGSGVPGRRLGGVSSSGPSAFADHVPWDQAVDARWRGWAWVRISLSRLHLPETSPTLGNLRLARTEQHQPAVLGRSAMRFVRLHWLDAWSVFAWQSPRITRRLRRRGCEFALRLHSSWFGWLVVAGDFPCPILLRDNEGLFWALSWRLIRSLLPW